MAHERTQNVIGVAVSRKRMNVNTGKHCGQHMYSRGMGPHSIFEFGFWDSGFPFTFDAMNRGFGKKTSWSGVF